MIEVHAYIDVAELERGIAFYCDGLGLSLKRRLSPSWVQLAGANLPIFLLGNAIVDRPVQDREYGRMANMADPFGNGFDLIEFAGSGYDDVSR